MITICIYFLYLMVFNVIFQEFDENSPDGLSSVTLNVIKTRQNVNNHLARLLTKKERGKIKFIKLIMA